MTPKFDFADTATLSYAEMLARVKTDPTFPAKRRPGAVTNMNRVLNWYQQTRCQGGGIRIIDPARIPFDGPTLKAMFRIFVPVRLDVSRKSIQNAKADLKFVAAFYRISRRQAFVPLTEEMRTACGLVRSQFDRYEVSRFLHFLAARHVALAEVAQHHFEAFCEALKNDWTIVHPDMIGARTRRTWNRLARNLPNWPQVRFSGGKRKERFGLPLSAFPVVEREATAFLRRGLDFRTAWDGPDAEAPILRPATIFTQMEQYRLAASCLVRAGVPITEITGLRSLCTPENFRCLVNCYIAHLGKTNRSVELLADVLLKTARYANVLEPAETKDVEQLHAKLRRRVVEFEKTKENKGERLLHQFDSAEVMDAFIALPQVTVARVIGGGQQDRTAAYLIQCALILELWLCAPLRLSTLLSLRIDRHFFRITIDDTEHIVLRIPPEETKNHRPLEHLLHEDAASLLQDYMDRWYSMIAKNDSPYLIPGANGGPKSKQVLAVQMRKYIRKGCGVEFHPHLIRRIVAKLILDDEAGSLETARRQLGHADTRMLLHVYAQRENRAVQKRYLAALQARRLSAIERLGARRRDHAA